MLTIRPILIGAAGVLALQLLTVRAGTTVPVDPPKGWSVSDSIGTQYRLGYDSGEGAYFIESARKIETVGHAVNAKTAASGGERRVPYSSTGLKASDPWAASMLQSVKATPYRKHTIRFEAEVKASGFKGQFQLLLRAAEQGWVKTNTVTLPADESGNWFTLVAAIEEIPDFPLTEADDSVVSFGFLMQGEGRILMRNAKLTSTEITPSTPPPKTPLVEMFRDPPTGAQPVNLELRP